MNATSSSPRTTISSITTQEEQQVQTHCTHSPMLKTATYTSYHLTRNSPSHFRPIALNLSRTVPIPITSTKAKSFHTTAAKMESKKVEEYKQAGNRKNAVPEHEMVLFKGLMSEKRAFGDFRTVLHTGLHSQIVAMEVPVGGDIGDEVSHAFSNSLRRYTFLFDYD